MAEIDLSNGGSIRAEDGLGQFVSHLKERARVEQVARARYAMGAPGAAFRRAKYRKAHDYYAPPNGDQWPQDRVIRQGKVHITANIIKAFVDIEARLLALEPRIVNKPPTQDQAAREKSEVIEEFYSRLLDLSDWSVWFHDWNLVKGLYGQGILHPFWNTDDGRPDVVQLDQPQNLLIGYGSSDYTVKDWAIYRYSISIIEAKARFPQLTITPAVENKKGEKTAPLVVFGQGDHADPLSQQTSGTGGSALAGGENNTLITNVGNRRRNEEYERQQVEVWDYWYRDPDNDNTVTNAVLCGGVLTDEPKAHPELPKIPYIVCENWHEPGQPDGVSTAELLFDLQISYNRVLSNFSQMVADSSGTAYQLKGETADVIPEGLVPSIDEIVPTGMNNSVDVIPRNQNITPPEMLIDKIWETCHRVTGIPEIAFGELSSSQESGRATAVQVQATANRLEVKQKRVFKAMRELFLFWGYMLKQRNPSVTVTRVSRDTTEGTTGEEPVGLVSEKIEIGDFIDGFENWQFKAAELTPRDSIEQAQSAMQLVNAKLLPLSMAMDMIGVDNPEQAIDLIRKERSDARLFPADVQLYAAVVQLIQQIQQAQQSAQQPQPGLGPQGQAGAAAQQQAATQQAQPTGFEDQNQLGGVNGVPPGSGPGQAPPPGSPAPGGIGGMFQPMIRETTGGQLKSLNRTQLPPVKF